MHQHRDPTHLEAHRLRGFRVHHPLHALDLDEVVAGTHRADLTAPPVPCPLRHGPRLRTGQAPAGLGVEKVRARRHAPLDQATAPFGEDAVELVVVQHEPAATPGAGRDAAAELVDQRLEA